MRRALTAQREDEFARYPASSTHADQTGTAPEANPAATPAVALRTQLSSQLAVATDAASKLAARLAAARAHARLAAAAERDAAQAAEAAQSKSGGGSNVARQMIDAAVTVRDAAAAEELRVRADMEQAHALLTAAREVRELAEAEASAATSAAVDDSLGHSTCATKHGEAHVQHADVLVARESVQRAVEAVQQAQDKLASRSVKMAANRQAKEQIQTAVQAAAIKMVELRRAFTQGSLDAERYESLALELAAVAGETATDQQTATDQEPVAATAWLGQEQNELDRLQRELELARGDLRACITEETRLRKQADTAKATAAQAKQDLDAAALVEVSTDEVSTDGSSASQELENVAAALSWQLTDVQNQLAAAQEAARIAEAARIESEAQSNRLVSRSMQAARLGEAECEAELEHRRMASENAANEAVKLEAEVAHGAYEAAAARKAADQAKMRVDDARRASEGLQRQWSKLKAEAETLRATKTGPSSVVIEVAAWVGMRQDEMEAQLVAVGVSSSAAGGLAKMLASDGTAVVTLPTPKQAYGIIDQLESLQGLRCSLQETSGNCCTSTSNATHNSCDHDMPSSLMALKSEIERLGQNITESETECIQLDLTAQAQAVLLEARRSEAALANSRRGESIVALRQTEQEVAEMVTKRRAVEESGKFQLADAQRGAEQASRADQQCIAELQLRVEELNRRLAAAEVARAEMHEKRNHAKAHQRKLLEQRVEACAMAAAKQARLARDAADRRHAAELAVSQCSSAVQLAGSAAAQVEQARVAAAEAAEKQVQDRLQGLRAEIDQKLDDAEQTRLKQDLAAAEAEESNARRALSLCEDKSLANFGVASVDAARRAKTRHFVNASAVDAINRSTANSQREEDIASASAIAAVARHDKTKAILLQLTETEARTRDEANNLSTCEGSVLHEAARNTRHARAVADAAVVRLEHELKQARDLVSAVQTLQEETDKHVQGVKTAERQAHKNTYAKAHGQQAVGPSVTAVSTPSRCLSPREVEQMGDKQFKGRNQTWSELLGEDHRWDGVADHPGSKHQKVAADALVDTETRHEYQDLAQGGSLQAQTEWTPPPTPHHRSFEPRGVSTLNRQRNKSPKPWRPGAGGREQFAQLPLQRRQRLLHLSSPTRAHSRTPSKESATHAQRKAKKKPARQARTQKEEETAARLHNWHARKEEELAWQRHQKQVREQEEFAEEQARAAEMAVGARLSVSERHERHQRALANSVGRIWKLARGVYEQAVYSASEDCNPQPGDENSSDLKWKVRAEFSRAIRNQELSLTDAQQAKLQELVESGVEDGVAIASLLRGENSLEDPPLGWAKLAKEEARRDRVADQLHRWDKLERDRQTRLQQARRAKEEEEAERLLRPEESHCTPVSLGSFLNNAKSSRAQTPSRQSWSRSQRRPISPVAPRPYMCAHTIASAEKHRANAEELDQRYRSQYRARAHPDLAGTFAMDHPEAGEQGKQRQKQLDARLSQRF